MSSNFPWLSNAWKIKHRDGAIFWQPLLGSRMEGYQDLLFHKVLS